MGLTAPAAVVLAATLDALVGEPPNSVHPVAWFGRAVGPLDRDWTHPLAVGAACALVLPLLATGVVGAVVWTAGRASPWFGAVVAGLSLFAATSQRMLLDEAAAVVDLSASDLPAARERLLSLAGRDASELDAAQVRSAAVESLAENLADGLVAPLLAFVALSAVSLPAAAAAAAWVKAVNTMDSMLGYREKRVGTPAARLDDAVMWAPARVTALVLALAAPSLRALSEAQAWADAPDSPNSGWPMATIAAALVVRLEKPGAYDLRPEAALPDPADGAGALALARRAGWLAIALGAAGSFLVSSPSAAPLSVGVVA